MQHWTYNPTDNGQLHSEPGMSVWTCICIHVRECVRMCVCVCVYVCVCVCVCMCACVCKCMHVCVSVQAMHKICEHPSMRGHPYICHVCFVKQCCSVSFSCIVLSSFCSDLAERLTFSSGLSMTAVASSAIFCFLSASFFFLATMSSLLDNTGSRSSFTVSPLGNAEPLFLVASAEVMWKS